MEDKDTVMKDPCLDCPRKEIDAYGYLCDLACGQQTAYLNFQFGRQAGIKEVVDWIETMQPLEFNGLWQSKLKEWGG